MKKNISFHCMLTFFMIFLITGPLFAKGNDPAAELQKIHNLYPHENAVYMNYTDEIKISLSGDSLLVEGKHFEEIFHLSEMTDYMTRGSIYCNSFNDVNSIQARTYVPLKNKYKRVDVSDFRETFDKNSGIFYEDSKYINFIYPSVQAGARTELEYKINIKDPRFIPAFYFQSGIPIIHAKYIVKYDTAVKVEFRIYNRDKRIIETTTTEGKWRTEQFEMDHADRLPDEDESPSYPYYAPHVFCIVQGYHLPGKPLKTVLASSDDLCHWYYTFIRGLDAGLDP